MYMPVNKGKLGFQGKFYWQTNFENFIFKMSEIRNNRLKKSEEHRRWVSTLPPATDLTCVVTQ